MKYYEGWLKQHQAQVKTRLPLSPAPLVAVGLSCDLENDQNHTGLYWHEEQGQPRYLNLQGHLRLTNELPPPECIWVILPVHRLRVPAVAGYCRLLWEANGEDTIPYGIQFPDNAFDPVTGLWFFGPDRFGLTCATFVLAALKAQGIELLQLDTWEYRDSDDIWKNKIIRWLENSGNNRRAQFLRQEEQCFRYRPEEVAGASLERSLPVDFSTATTNGEILMAILANRSAQ